MEANTSLGADNCFSDGTDVITVIWKENGFLWHSLCSTFEIHGALARKLVVVQQHLIWQYYILVNSKKLHECVSNSTNVLDEISESLFTSFCIDKEFIGLFIEMWYCWHHPLSHLIKDIFGGSKPWSCSNLQYSSYRYCAFGRNIFNNLGFKDDLMSTKY